MVPIEWVNGLTIEMVENDGFDTQKTYTIFYCPNLDANANFQVPVIRDGIGYDNNKIPFSTGCFEAYIHACFGS